MVLDCLEKSIVRNVYSEMFMQRLEYVGAKLGLKVLVAVFCVFEGNIGKGAEEIVVVDDPHVVDRIEVLLLNMLLEAAGSSAGLGTHLSIEEVIAAFKGALQKRAGIMAYSAGKIVGRDVRRCASWSSQSYGEASGKVEEHFRHEIAGIADGFKTIFLSLFHEVVICLLKELLKVDKMFKVFQQITPYKNVCCLHTHIIPMLKNILTICPEHVNCN